MADLRHDRSPPSEPHPSVLRGVAGLRRRARRQATAEAATEAEVQDEVTGPLSRRRMHEAINSALMHLRDGGEPTAVLLLDVDTSEGDRERTLEIAAGRLAVTLRPEDLVGHYGHDMFVVVARDVADEGAAHKVAARLTRALERPLNAADDAIAVHVRIALSMVHEADPSASDVVARVDGAMHDALSQASRDTHDHAKAYAERNKANRDAHDASVISPDAGREALVKAAFDRSSIVDFDICYQPIADLRGGSVAAVEASLRWEHQDLGAIDPDEFLPIAEQRGQMVTLGSWTIEKACTQTIRWAATRDGRPMRTCVHVSPSQVGDPDFLRNIRSALAVSGASGQQLALLLARDALDAASPELLEGLADARIALILDHRAAHPPASSDVANLPVSMVRVDRSLADGDPDAFMLRGAELARSLDLPAVMQGVETREQLRAALGSGFPLAQGPLFSRPQSAATIEMLVGRERPFAASLAPAPIKLGALDDAGREPVVELGAPAVP